ncbi:hypothetical protein KKA14_00065 [bacterium]|nr:hypothetical protein [bacterium]
MNLLNDTISGVSLEQAFKNYTQVLSWMDEETTFPEKICDRQQWIEFISDQYHIHRKKSGIGISEHDLLPHVIKGDRNVNTPWIPIFQHKVALDNLRSAFNVGSIFRLIDAVGFESVIIGGKTPGKENNQVRKAAMGATKWIPEEKSENLTASLNRYKTDDYVITGIETVAGSESYLEFPWPKKSIVVLGNEEYGLSRDVIKTCDQFVHLPMIGKKNSVNVANAFAVIAFHINSIQVKSTTRCSAAPY